MGHSFLDIYKPLFAVAEAARGAGGSKSLWKSIVQSSAKGAGANLWEHYTDIVRRLLEQVFELEFSNGISRRIPGNTASILGLIYAFFWSQVLVSEVVFSRNRHLFPTEKPSSEGWARRHLQTDWLRESTIRQRRETLFKSLLISLKWNILRKNYGLMELGRSWFLVRYCSVFAVGIYTTFKLVSCTWNDIQCRSANLYLLTDMRVREPEKALELLFVRTAMIEAVSIRRSISQLSAAKINRLGTTLMRSVECCFILVL